MRKMGLVLMWFLMLPVFAWASEYVLVKGKGVEVCEEYGKNLNSVKPIPLILLKPLERKLNPEFKDFSKPQWEAIFNQALFDKINIFLWERDANPIYYFPVTEYKEWSGTPKQYAWAWDHYKANRQKLLVHGLPISRVDIDNDGKIDNVALDSTNKNILLVLNEDNTAIDMEKTALLLQHPSRKVEGRGEINAEGKRIEDALHHIYYDVFIYKKKTYFDLFKHFPYEGKWAEGKKKGDKTIKDILRVFITENQKTEELCTYQFQLQ